MVPYAAVMVHFEGGDGGRRRAQLAADLAGRFDAVLIGIAGYSYLPAFPAEWSAADGGANDGDKSGDSGEDGG